MRAPGHELTIGELARLAGTTSRTVRHYHQIGLLPEPRRSEAGYRKYGVVDLLTLLKARRLASFGMPLERVKQVLGAGAVEATALLDELDTELAAQINALEAQRRVLALLRQHAVDPQVPEEFAPHFSALRAAGAPEEHLGKELDLVLLMSSFGIGEGLERAYRAQLAAVSDVTEYVEFTKRLEALADVDADAPEVEEVARDYIRLMEPVIPELRNSVEIWTSLDPTAEALLQQHELSAASPAQWRVMEILAQELGRRLEGEDC